MTKVQIIQRLLDENHITVEDATVLITQDTVSVNQYIPTYKICDPSINSIWYTTYTNSMPIFETNNNSPV